MAVVWTAGMPDGMPAEDDDGLLARRCADDQNHSLQCFSPRFKSVHYPLHIKLRAVPKRPNVTTIAINIAIEEEPIKLTTSHAGVSFTSQILAMVVEIIMIAGINGTRIETPKEGRIIHIYRLICFQE